MGAMKKNETIVAKFHIMIYNKHSEMIPTERMYTMADEIKTNESQNFIHAFITEDIAPGGQFEGM